MMLGSDVIKRLEDAVTPFVQVLVHALHEVSFRSPATPNRTRTRHRLWKERSSTPGCWKSGDRARFDLLRHLRRRPERAEGGRGPKTRLASAPDRRVVRRK